jgi:hypothetical protein
MGSSDIDAELAALSDMTWPELRERWSALTGRPVPKVKHALLRLAIAWELQASIYGALSRRSQQRLGQIAGAEQGGGTKLVREWKGVLHTVMIMDDETIHWNGRKWNSLSQVARAITGTRWSGPVFFGLKSGSKAA